MEDALSSLLRADREHRRSRLNPINISYAPGSTTTTSDHQELTHAMVLEQCNYFIVFICRHHRFDCRIVFQY